MNAATTALHAPPAVPCRHCGYLLDRDQEGRWRDRVGNGWCPGGLLAHDPVPSHAPVGRS